MIRDYSSLGGASRFFTTGHRELADVALSTPSIVVVGSNHEYASVDIRERLAFAGDSLTGGLRALNVHVDEGFILSTCNRTEIYVATDNKLDGHREIFEFLSGYHSVPLHMLERASYTFQGEEAVQHLFRVAAGLDSMVLGEPQILSQIRDALAIAREAQSVGPMLQRLATDALRIGKRARTETDISRNRLSIAHAAMDLVATEMDDLASKTAVVIGAGKMGSLAAKLLAARGVGRIRVVNRSVNSAQKLAAAVRGEAIPMSGLAYAMADADIVIAAVASNGFVVTPGMIEDRATPLLLVDLSVPRSVDASCGSIRGVTVRDVDALEALAEATRETYAAEISKVEVLVESAVSDFNEWQHSRFAVKAISDVRQRADSIREAELDRALRKLSHLSERDLNVVRALSTGVTNKLLHEPILSLRHAGSLHALRYIAATQGVDLPFPGTESLADTVPDLPGEHS
jgi:glutamyl-tRNA reductase